MYDEVKMHIQEMLDGVHIQPANSLGLGDCSIGMKERWEH